MSKKDAETQTAPEQQSNVNGEVSDEALLNAWVVGVQYVNPGDPDGPEGPLTSKASKSSKG